jgi:autotransporter-associated beta strand protein
LVGTAFTLPSGGSNVNTLNIANSTTTAVAFNFASSSDVLNLTSGGLIVQNVIASAAATTIGASANSGIITAGGTSPSGPQDLYFYYYANGGAVLTVNSKITDNGSSPVRLIAYGGDWGASNITLQGTNTYSGGTVINAETLTVGATGTLPYGTAGITINGGTLAQTSGGVIATQAGTGLGQTVTMNGGSTLTLAGTNTLSSLTINNNGGTVPNVTTAGTLLNLSGGITAYSMNPIGPSTITAGTIDIGSGASTFNVYPVTANGLATGTVVAPYEATLNITAVLQSVSTTGTLNVSGGGLLQLSGTNTYGQPWMTSTTLQQNTGLILNVAGALGSGVLSVAGNGTSITGSAGITVANPVNLTSSVTGITIGNYAGSALTLSGPIMWNSNSLNITTNTTSAQTLQGAIVGGSSTATLTKSGVGTLVLGTAALGSGASLNLTGPQAVQIQNGLLQLASDEALGMIPAAPVAGNILIAGGGLSGTGTLTLNSYRGIQLGSSAAPYATLDAAASAVFTIESPIANASGVSSVTLTKTGSGAVYLANGNTFSGQVNVAVGNLRVQNGYALGSPTGSNSVQVFNGAALEFDNTWGPQWVGQYSSGSFVGMPVTINGTGISAAAGALSNISGQTYFGGNITLGSNAEIGATAGTLTLTGNITGTAVDSITPRSWPATTAASAPRSR